MNDLRERMKSAIASAERRDGGTAHHMRIGRDGHISVETSRADISPQLAHAYPVEPRPAVLRGAMQGQGEFDELLAMLPPPRRA
jgi:hypothetical protein